MESEVVNIPLWNPEKDITRCPILSRVGHILELGMDWESKLAELRLVVDGMGRRIDPGIIEVVAALQLAGIETSASCEGHEDGGCPYPWVDIPLRHRDRVELLIEGHGVRIEGLLRDPVTGEMWLRLAATEQETLADRQKAMYLFGGALRVIMEAYRGAGSH